MSIENVIMISRDDTDLPKDFLDELDSLVERYGLCAVSVGHYGLGESGCGEADSIEITTVQSYRRIQLEME